VIFSRMSDSKLPTPESADWTHLLTDPDLVSHLGKLLKTYREATPEQREHALLEAMREIKSGQANKTSERSSHATSHPAPSPAAVPANVSPAMAAAAVAPAPDPPPFEPDIFTPNWGQDRRMYPRLKCFVAVEIHIKGAAAPIWGNLSNTSMGGCFIESVTPIGAGEDVEIGLWLASGKIWVKGMVLNGVVTKSTPSFGIRVRFAPMEGAGRESLRHFLKFVESTTKGYQKDHGYLAQLKR
jgi:PilZ domain-containing protein